MKRMLRVAAVAVLGLSIASYATILMAQPPAAPRPDTPVPIVLPGGPTPSLPAPTIPVAIPDSKPLVPLPSGPSPVTLPESKPVITLPSDIKPTITMPKDIKVSRPSDAKPTVTLPVDSKPISLPGTQPNPTPTTEYKPQSTMDEHPTYGVNNENPTGRQEPAVSLEWVGPLAAKVGHPADYSIVVRNVCNIPVQQVLVRVRLPQGVAINATEPKAVSEDNVLMWDVGTMLPKQERNLQMKLVSNTKGDANCQAWVTFTGASAMKIKIREPKLLIKATAPERVLVGDGANIMLTVSNPGDHPAEQVKILAVLSEGLIHARGQKIDYELGNLAPGETRSVQVLCDTKAGGTQFCEAFAEAEGGLKAVDKAALNVIMPQLKVEILGPKLRYLERKALYRIKVTNPGDAAATNVQLSNMVPAGFRFISADNGGRHDFSSRSVAWFLGEVGPGQSKEVSMEVLCVNKGEHIQKVTATAARGLRIEDELLTRVEGLSAIALEMIDLEDPVEVGAETTYEIRVTNTGTQTENDVKLICTVPDKMQFKSATGPARFTQNGNEIVFDFLPKLAPRADAIFRVTVKTTAAGVVNFKSRLTSQLLVDPVHKEEATRIYAD